MNRATLALVLLLAGCALTPEQLRVAFHATNVADVGTTLARDPACMSEGNPLLGANPSDGKVIAFGALASLVYEGIYWHLEDAPLGERLAFGRAFMVVKAIGPVNNAVQLARGCR